jgi:predicted metal-dependent phosphoesterase TrpH
MKPLTHSLIVDLHVHTNYSHDGRDSVKRIIERAIVKKLDGIALCDHDTMEGFYAARKYVADLATNLLLIPGIEVTTSRGHLLVLGVEDGIEKGLSPEETIRIARQQEKEGEGPVVIIAPHPYHPFRHSIGNFCTHPGIDAIEVFNSRYVTGIANRLASKTAARVGITTVAGSDAHSAEYVGLATVAVEIASGDEEKTDYEAILRAIKAGTVSIKDTNRTPFGVFFSQMCGKNRSSC